MLAALEKKSRTEIESSFQISGKKGLEGTTFVATDPVTEHRYAIKLFSNKKSVSKLKLEAEMQSKAADVGVAPHVYYYSPTEKFIIMDALVETIVERGRREKWTKTPYDYQAMIYALCMRLDEAGVIQNDGNPLNLMVDKLGHLYIIDYGFAKEITPAVIKKRGPQPNVNLTLWHFARHLKHYKHLGQNNLNDIVDKYLKSNDYVDTTLRDHGENLLKGKINPSVADALPGGESKRQETISTPPPPKPLAMAAPPKPPAMERPERPQAPPPPNPPAMERPQAPKPQPLSRAELRKWATQHRHMGINGNSKSVDIQRAMAAPPKPPAMERPERPQAPPPPNPPWKEPKPPAMERPQAPKPPPLSRAELRKWATQHRHMGINGNSKSVDIQRAMARHRHEEAAKIAMRAIGKFISSSKKNEPFKRKKRSKATTPRLGSIYRQFVKGDNSKEAMMARIETRKRGR